MITKEDLNLLSQSFDKQVKKAVDAIIEANRQAEEYQRNWFKETERLLYSYPALKLKVAQDEEVLKDPAAILLPAGKSKDIVRFSSHGGSCGMDLDVYTESRKASMLRTLREVQRIERALETIQEDQYYDIVPLKYFDLVQGEQIAEAMNCDERTYRRHKNRLVNKIKIILFGADAL